jgi:hypothetical protein
MHACCGASDESLKPDGMEGANGKINHNTWTGSRMNSVVFIMKPWMKLQ